MDSTATVPLLFYWPNGNPVNPAFWGPAEPDNYGGTPTYLGQGCVTMSSGFAYKLDDEACLMQRDLYCEYST